LNGFTRSGIQLTNYKQRFIRFLLILTVLLLIADVLIDRIKGSENPPGPVIQNELSVKKIENTFFKVLDEYGIETSWISKKKVKPSEDDSVKLVYTVKIPSDVPVPLIIRDINIIIEKEITGFVSEEKKIFGSTEIRIYTNEVQKLKAVLVPDKNLVRNRNSLSFIISDALELSSGNFNDFLSIPQPLACFVIPDKSLIAQVDTLKNYRKEFVMLLNDDISDPKMKMKQEFQKELLRGSIKNIISAFKSAKMYSVDEKSALFNSPIYNFVRDDFKRNGINLYPLSEFIRLNAAEEPELLSKLRFYSNDTTGVKQKIFLCTFDNFLKILPALDQFKKRGHKIVALSKSYRAQIKN
jgi:hypothetical protein